MARLKYKNGTWVFEGKIAPMHPTYADFLLRCLKGVGRIFDLAKEKSEFEFIIALLRVKGVEGPGWDVWENTIKIVDSMYRLKRKAEDFETEKFLFFWVYGHIVEASEPYEIISNMLGIAGGNRSQSNQFPDKKVKRRLVPQSPKEKMDQIIEKADKLKLKDTVNYLNEILDRELRNAVFHSDFSLYSGELRLGPKGARVLSHLQTQDITNKALAYFESLKILINIHRKEYDKPKVIDIHPGFTKDKEEKAVTIIRRGDGLAGIKDNWTPEQIKQGKITFRLGRFSEYETRIMRQDPQLCILPPDRIKRFNRLIKFLPRFVRKKAVKLAQKSKWFS